MQKSGKHRADGRSGLREKVSESGRHISEDGADMEQTGSFGQFIWFVPAADDILNGRVEGGLGQADEEADRNKTVESVRSGESHGEHAPDQFHGGDPDGRTESGDEEATIVCEGRDGGQTFKIVNRL